jgi:Outer membrane protein beta-barrel domain
MSILNRVFCMVVAVAVVTIAQPAHSAPVGGDNEAEVAGGFFHSQGSDNGSFNVDLQYGYYLTPGWEVGLRQGLNYNFVDDGPDSWLARTTPFLLYNFHLNERVIPFVGAAMGLVWNDRDATGLLGPQVGAKIFLTDQTYLGLRYQYEWFFNSLKRAGNNADHGNHVGTIGFGFVWGGARKTSG